MIPSTIESADPEKSPDLAKSADLAKTVELSEPYQKMEAEVGAWKNNAANNSLHVYFVTLFFSGFYCFNKIFQ